MRRAVGALALVVLGCTPGGAVRVELTIDGVAPDALAIRAREQGAVAWRLDCLLASDGTGTCPFEGGDALWSGGPSLAFLLEGRAEARLEIEVTARRAGETIDRVAAQAVIPATGPRVLSLSLRPPSVPRRRCATELPIVDSTASDRSATGLTLRKGADGRAEAFVYARGGLFRLRYEARPEDPGACGLSAEPVPLGRSCRPLSLGFDNVLAAGDVDQQAAGEELVLVCENAALSINPDSDRSEQVAEDRILPRTGPVLARLDSELPKVLFVSGQSWVSWVPPSGALVRASAASGARSLRQLVMRRPGRLDLALLFASSPTPGTPPAGYLWSTADPRRIGDVDARPQAQSTPSSRTELRLIAMNADRAQQYELEPDASPPTLTPDGRVDLGAPVLGDVTGDGRPSALRLAGGQLQLVGLSVSGVTTRQPESLTLTDSDLRLASLDGRPGAEILAFDEAGVRVFAFDASGGAMPGFPVDVLDADGTSALRLAVANLDGDTTIELVAISGTRVGVVSLGYGSYDADHMPWPMEAQGPGRAGGYAGERDPLAP